MRAADKLDEYWFHLRMRDVELPGKHMLRLDNLGVMEFVDGDGKTLNALRKTFGPVPGASHVVTI